MKKPEFTKVSSMQDAIKTTSEFLEYHRDVIQRTEPHATVTINAIDEVLMGLPIAKLHIIKSTE